MRKFIVSDLHGNGDVYDSIMGYLDNISNEEEVELYINGDLIDRGKDSFTMLMDVIERINGKGNIKIHYLGGNHELMMYDALRKRRPGKSISHWCDWMRNGGGIIEGELDIRDDGEELCETFKNFVGDLKIYHVFDEKILDKNMLLVHAQAPIAARDNIDLRIKDNNFIVERAVWTRRDGSDPILSLISRAIGLERVGLDDFFTIIGHTPVDNNCGFIINERENFINIDGGCAAYAYGYHTYDHVPLLEVKGNGFDITIFNHSNKIINGYYYDGELSKISLEELNKKRKYLITDETNNKVYGKK